MVFYAGTQVQDILLNSLCQDSEKKEKNTKNVVIAD